MSYKINYSKVDVLYFHDEETGEYTFTTVSKGGPIITANNIEEGKKKFIEAMDVASAIHNLLYYKNAETNKSKAEARRRLSHQSKDVNFVAAQSI